MTLTNGNAWPDEHIERLAKLYAEKVPASMIAAMLTTEFGVTRTRNSVLGKAHRLKITTSREEENKRRANKRRQAKETAARNTVPSLASGPLIQGGIVFTDAGIRWQREHRLPAPLPPCEEIEGGVTLADIGPGQCRFIPGEPAGLDTLFCGKPVLGGKSYCPECFNRTMADWQPRLVLGRAA